MGQLHLARKTQNTQRLSRAKIIEKDLLKGGVSFRGLGLSAATYFLNHFFDVSLRVIGFGHPTKGQKELFLHLHGGLQLIPFNGVEEGL